MGDLGARTGGKGGGEGEGAAGANRRLWAAGWLGAAPFAALSGGIFVMRICQPLPDLSRYVCDWLKNQNKMIEQQAGTNRNTMLTIGLFKSSRLLCYVRPCPKSSISNNPR